MQKKSIVILVILAAGLIGHMLGVLQVVPLLAYISIPLGLVGIMLAALLLKPPQEEE